MRPGELTIRALLLIAVSALAVPFAMPFVYVVSGALGLLLGACAIEAMILRRIVVSAEEDGPRVISLGVAEEVALRLRTNAERPVRLRVRLNLPPLFTEPAMEMAGHCRPGEILRLAFPVRGIARGRAALAAPHAAMTHWGFVERVLSLGQERDLAVFPDLKAVARLHRQLNRFALRGFGTRLSARLGKGREFDRMREYVRGDEYRDVAWKASARHSKLIVREYRLDRSQDVLLCLDRGHRMAARVAQLSKLDHAVNAAVLLAYVCNRMEDRFGALTFGDIVEAGPGQGKGATHLRRITDFTASAQAAYRHSDYLALAADLRRRVRHRTLIVIFTALPEMEHDALLRAARVLSPPHLMLVAVLTDPDLRATAQILPASKDELCRTLVAQDICAARDQTVRELRRMGALVVESSPTDIGLASMNAYIEIKRRQLL
ncbi:MAG: DUF58 domain-containing protein [Vicinamibacteria bacterium]|nr:DUF58 domain-containing protein [Vicinamibacteria bacterium]